MYFNYYEKEKTYYMLQMNKMNSDYCDIRINRNWMVLDNLMLKILMNYTAEAVSKYTNEDFRWW